MLLVAPPVTCPGNSFKHCIAVASGRWGKTEGEPLDVEYVNTAVKHAHGSLIMFFTPIIQAVRESQKSRTISADERACVRIAADNGIMLWSLTPLLALSGQTIENLYYKEGHWTAAAHEMAARSMSRCITRRLAERRQVMRPEPIN